RPFMLRPIHPLIRSSSVSTVPSRWKLAPNACHGHSIRLGAGLQMAILAGQIVTGKTFRRVRNVGPDLIWRIGEKRVPVFDKFSERILTNLADIGGRPLSEIDHDRLCRRHLIASYPYTGTQSSNYEPNRLHWAGVVPRPILGQRVDVDSRGCHGSNSWAQSPCMSGSGS